MNKKIKTHQVFIILGILLISIGSILIFFNNNDSKSNKEDNKNQDINNNDDNNNKQDINNNDDDDNETNVLLFEGIYQNKNNKLFINKYDDNNICYIVEDSGGGYHQGKANVKGKKAEHLNFFGDDTKLQFKIVDKGINIDYDIIEFEFDVDKGLYEKEKEYSIENIYKEIVGDSKFLESKYNGLFKNNDIEIYVYQVSENKILVKSNFFEEEFEIENDNKLISKSIDDENVINYIIEFNNNNITLKINENSPDFTKELKDYELTYKFNKKLTQKDIIEKYYNCN